MPFRWDEETDVIVIGSGFAGLAAAIEAKLAGASVIILEKMKGYGGNSTISAGCMAAAGTELQRKFGIDDSPQQMVGDMLKAGRGLNHPDLVEIVAGQSADVFQWLREFLGVAFLDRVDQIGGHSVPRSYTTHNRSGSSIIKQLLAKIRSLEIRVFTKTYLQSIIKKGDGRVGGVLARRGYMYPDAFSGDELSIKAKKGVILASGGFGNDIDFRLSQDPRLGSEVSSTNKYSTTADAMKAALQIGAMPVQLSWIQLGPWASPDEKGYGVGPDFASYTAFPYGMMVDPATGKRIVNELADRKTRADAILDVGHACIAISDSKGPERSGYPIAHCLRRGIVKAYDTVKEVADGYDMPANILQETIEQFNRSIEAGCDTEFDKPILPNAEPLKTAPYYAMRLWPKVHYTMGGLLINTRAQVLDVCSQPINGLLAAGEVTGGIHGASRLGSCAITDCLVFGRIAGRNAAA